MSEQPNPAPATEGKPAEAKAPEAKAPEAKPAAKPAARPAAPKPADAPRATEDRAVATSRKLRRKRARRLAIGAALTVGLPTLIAAIYFGAIATPQYESFAAVAVESSERVAPTGEGLESFLPHAGSSRDLQVARDYLESRAMLDLLEADHGFVAHFADPAADRWSRLAADASRERRYAYFRDVVDITSDHAAGTLRLRVRAFDAAKAQELARAMVAGAEAMMNDLAARTWKAQLELGEREVTEARERLAAAATGLAAAAPDATDAATIERDLARRRLEAAAEGLEQARAASRRERRYLVAVAAPSLPEDPTLPRRGWSVATVFALAVALSGVLSLLVAAVREHARF